MNRLELADHLEDAGDTCQRLAAALRQLQPLNDMVDANLASLEAKLAFLDGIKAEVDEAAKA